MEELSRLELVVLKGISLKLKPDKIAEAIGNIDPDLVWNIANDLYNNGYITIDGKLTEKGYNVLSETETKSSIKDFGKLKEATKPKNEVEMKFIPETKARYHFSAGWVYAGILFLAIGFLLQVMTFTIPARHSLGPLSFTTHETVSFGGFSPLLFICGAALIIVGLIPRKG